MKFTKEADVFVHKSNTCFTYAYQNHMHIRKSSMRSSRIFSL